MTLPTPLRMARAIALFQGWAAGLGVFVMLGVAVLAAGGLRNGAFVALALLFLAGDVLAVSVAVVIAARRLAEGAAWARLLLDVVEGVTIAVGLLAILMGTGILGFGGAVLGVTVILCLHMPSSNAVFAGQPILPWEASRPEPRAPVFPVPSLPPRRRSGMARPPAGTPTPPVRRPVTPPAWEPSPPSAIPQRYSWERPPSPHAPSARVPRPADLPSAGARSIPPIEPLPPLAPPAAPPMLVTPPPVVPPPDEPPGRPFVVPPLERIAEVPRHATPPPPDPSEAPAVRPFVVPDPAGSEANGKGPAETVEMGSAKAPAAAAAAGAEPPELAPAPAAEKPAPAPPPAAAVAEPAAPAAAQPSPSTVLPPAAVAATPAAPPPAPGPLWEPRPLPPPAPSAMATPTVPRRGSVTVYERRSGASGRPPARPARPGMPPAPSWAWRKVVIAASLLGAIGGGTLSAVELIAGGGTRLPSTGQAPAPPPPRSGSLPGGTVPAPTRPRTERSEPAAAGGVSGVTVTPEGGCAAGSTCTVTVRVDLDPHADELVAWSLVVVDRCSSQRTEIPVTGVPAPGSYRYVLSTNQVAVPGWRSPQLIAVTTSPARATSPAIDLGAGTGC